MMVVDVVLSAALVLGTAWAIGLAFVWGSWGK